MSGTTVYPRWYRATALWVSLPATILLAIMAITGFWYDHTDVFTAGLAVLLLFGVISVLIPVWNLISHG